MKTSKQPGQIVNTVLEHLRQKDAGVASCRAYEERTREINVDANAFSLMRTTFDRSVEISVYPGGKKGSVTVGSFDETDILRAAEDCLAAAEEAEADDAWQLEDRAGHQSFSDGVPEGDIDMLFQRVKELLEQIKREFPKIVIEQLVADHVLRNEYYGNSHGVSYERVLGAYHLWFMFTAQEDGKVTGYNYSNITTESLDKPLMDCGMIRQSLEDTERQLNPVPMEDRFTGTVLLTPKIAREIIGEALYQFTFDRALLTGNSVWKEKLGQKVADQRLTVSLKPRDKSVVCGARYTAEGYPAEDFDVIRNGVLNSFCLTKYAANKTGNERAGNNSFDLVIAPGSCPLKNLLSSIEKGLYVDGYSGGEPGPDGTFSAVAKNSFLIENGSITHPVTETMISGNLAEMLCSLRDLSAEQMEDGEGSVPYMAFDGLLISGR
ncbi:MAG: TldD/PmbA family protein [Lachnospiraceae bacterium]|nr:TldD/PmbA family protein [Lachnospiraceae bacterium]